MFVVLHRISEVAHRSKAKVLEELVGLGFRTVAWSDLRLWAGGSGYRRTTGRIPSLGDGPLALGMGGWRSGRCIALGEGPLG